MALLALSSANAAPVNVSSTNFEGCNALLNMGLYNVTQSDSAKAAEYQAMATFCAYDYSSSNISSSQSAQIEASYGLFSGGAGGSASRQEIITKQSQVCSLGFNSSKYWEKASAYSKTVYQGSLDAWNRCQELANKGMEFEVQPSSTMQGVNVAITAPSGFQAIFYGVTQHGQGRSICKIMANGKVTPISLTKPFTFDAASKVTVDCNRVMKKNGADLSADAQDMIFVTSAKNLVVPLAAIGSFSRVTADQLRSETKAAEDKLRSEIKFAVDSDRAWLGFVSFTELQTYHSECRLDFGRHVQCVSAAQRYCQAKNLGGVGTIQQWDGINASLLVGCIKSSEYIQ